MFLFLMMLRIILILTGLVSLGKRGPVFLYLLLTIVFIDCVNENLIVNHSMQWWKLPSNVFYNIYSFFEISAWFVIYYLIFQSPTIKIWIVISGTFIILYSLWELFIVHSLEIFHASSYACFSLASIIFSALYLFDINRKEYHNLSKDPAFWVSAGAIFFNAIFLINLFTVLDPIYWSHKGAKEIFDVLQYIADIMYYLLLCLAFITSYYKSHKVTTPVL